MAKMSPARAKASAKEAEDAVKRLKTKRGLAAPVDPELDAMEMPKTEGRPLSPGGPAPQMGGDMSEFNAMEGAKTGTGDLVVDAAGNATHNGVKVPGNFSRLLDIFGELGSKAKAAVGGVVDGAKGLMGSAAKAAPAMDPELAAMETAKTGTAPMVRAAAGRMGAAALSAPAAAFLAVMDPASTNEGEKDPGYRDMRQPIMTDPTNLNDQTQGAMGTDPGINQTAKPTMQPVDAPRDPRPQTGIGQAMPQAATMIDNVTGKVGGVQTGGGFYPTYEKGSAEGNSFSKAFAEAHKAGLSEFSWQGRRYNTEVAPDKSTQARPVNPNP